MTYCCYSEMEVLIAKAAGTGEMNQCEVNYHDFCCYSEMEVLLAKVAGTGEMNQWEVNYHDLLLLQ